MNSNDAIAAGYTPYPYTFPALQFTVWADSADSAEDDKDQDIIDEWLENTMEGGK
jgi:hypothetical protein